MSIADQFLRDAITTGVLIETAHGRYRLAREEELPEALPSQLDEFWIQLVVKQFRAGMEME